MDQMEAAGLPAPMTLGGTTLPLVGRARVYACGITPYDVTHVGHAAAFVWVDTLARVLRDGGAEVIICRNVLIYFNRPLQERVHALLYGSLGRRGFLGLGSRETIRFTPYEDRYEVVDWADRLYRKIA